MALLARFVRPSALAVTLCMAGVASVAPSPALAHEDAKADFAKLVADRAPAVVTIKFIMKDEQNEQEQETVGTMASGDGLVIVSNLSFGGMMALFGGGAPQPTNIKVLVGDDTVGVDAKFIARDTERGLAWVKTDKAPDKPYAFVDFTKGAEAKLGDEVYLVQLLGKLFDRAPSVSRGTIGAVVKKPRHILMPSVGLAGTEQGLAAYNAQGVPVGISTLILPEREEWQGADPSSIMRGVIGGMILPAKDVAEATTRALETAASAPSEAAPAEAEKPAAEPAAPAETPAAPK
jgi:S1-C subfamily serine protease